MQQILFAILTNEQARSSEVIETTLDQEFSVGAPWFDKILIESPDT